MPCATELIAGICKGRLRLYCRAQPEQPAPLWPCRSHGRRTAPANDGIWFHGARQRKAEPLFLSAPVCCVTSQLVYSACRALSTAAWSCVCYECHGTNSRKLCKVQTDNACRLCASQLWLYALVPRGRTCARRKRAPHEQGNGPPPLPLVIPPSPLSDTCSSVPQARAVLATLGSHSSPCEMNSAHGAHINTARCALCGWCRPAGRALPARPRRC